MKLLAFAVYDSKVEEYNRPFFARTRGEAVRMFSDSVNGADESLAKHSEDFTLFYIGEYDGSAGMFVPSEPVTLGNALQYRENGAGS